MDYIYTEAAPASETEALQDSLDSLISFAKFLGFPEARVTCNFPPDLVAVTLGPGYAEIKIVPAGPENLYQVACDSYENNPSGVVDTLATYFNRLEPIYASEQTPLTIHNNEVYWGMHGNIGSICYKPQGHWTAYLLTEAGDEVVGQYGTNMIAAQAVKVEYIARQ